MERGLGTASISSPASPSNNFRLSFQNTPEFCFHSEHEEETDKDSPEIPFASTGSSSPNYGRPCYSNSQASSGSTNVQGHYDHSSDHGSRESPNTQEYACTLTLPPPPGSTHRETYIVQMPKDQIFRVPPPENSNISERFRQPLAKKKSQRTNLRCCLPWLYGIAVLFMIAGLVIIGLQLFLKPLSPEFMVKKLVFKNSARPEYYISLEAKNPNKNIFSISYSGTEDASLFNNRKSIAEGGFPALEQGPKESSNVMISFSSLKKNALPPQIEMSLLGNKKRDKLEFSVDMDMLIRSKVMVMIPAIRSRNMSVKCCFTVDGLVPRANILAQKCTTVVQ